MNSLEELKNLKIPPGELLYSASKKKILVAYTSKQIEEIEKVYARCFTLQKNLQAIETADLSIVELNFNHITKGLIDLGNGFVKINPAINIPNIYIEEIKDYFKKSNLHESKVRRYFEIQNKSILGMATKNEKQEMRDLKQEIQSLLGDE